MIFFQDISVVVQGPISEYTGKTLQSVRKILPGAELILSTWKGSDIKNLDYDIAVLSDDPGGYEFCLDCGQLYNVNRLIVSTFEGIKRAKKPYILKLRSDMELHSSTFLNFFGSCPTKTEYSFLNQKILIGNIYTRNPHFSEKKILFHIGDFFYFGQKEDLLTIFDIRLATQNIASYFKIYEPFIEYNTKIFCKYFPEQFIWLSFVQKYLSVDLDHPFDSNKDLIELHDKILISNTILIDLYESGLECLKYPLQTIKDNDLYTYKDYFYLYHKISTHKFDLKSFIHFSIKKICFWMRIPYVKIKYIERFIRHSFKRKEGKC